MIAPLLASAVLAAGPVPLLDAPQTQSLAVAGDQVIVTRGGPPGRLRVDALAVDGNEQRSLLATPRLGPRWTVYGFVAASPRRVAIIAGWQNRAGVRVRVYTGPPTGPLRLETSVAGGRNWQRKWLPAGAAVDGDRVLVREVRLEPQRSRLRLYTPGAAPRRLPWSDGVLGPVVLAGRYVAFPVAAHRVVVADLESGARQASMKVDFASLMDVREDGTGIADGARGFVTIAPGRPRERVRGSEQLLGPTFAGDRIAALEFVDGSLRPAILDPGAAAPRPIGIVSDDLLQLDADPQGVAWLANGCVLYAPVDAVAPVEPPAGPCPRVEVGLSERDHTLRGRRLRVDIDCVAAPAPGCRGTVILRVRGIAGRARFQVEAGELGVAGVRLPPAAARIVRRRVQRRGRAALRMTWRVPDSRPDPFKTRFVVRRAS